MHDVKDDEITAYFNPVGIFQSYWQAGYEGAGNVNGTSLSLSINNTTQHPKLAYDNYLLADFEIGIVRACHAGARITCVSRIIFQLNPHLTTKEPQ
jgi:hypothetical protein